MSYVAEITDALENVPDDIALRVLSDVYQRITDWLADGGDHDDPYIQQQVDYVRRVEAEYGQKKPSVQ